MAEMVHGDVTFQQYILNIFGDFFNSKISNITKLISLISPYSPSENKVN